ncbi:MAG TPA: creatininase family protein [Devosiaceae bacterium]|nr:creatininase family protein [Devosiaceae bacterium]
MAIFHAEDLTAPEFAGFVTPRTVGVLPVAAIEPHGPHLPLSTDGDIARGHLSQLADYVPEEIDALVLPLQAVGLSIEHSGFAGVFSHGPETLLKIWADIAETFYAAGGRRLIVVSSHGGNSEVAGLLVTRLRLDPGMLAVTAAWLRFGQPDGLFADRELGYGIHGGDVETSLMLHYWPERVRLEERGVFSSAAEAWDSTSQVLSAHGRTRLGWLSHDLNPAGAVGNALAASAEKGAASAEHALRGFAALLADVADFDLRQLGGVR